MVEYCIGSLDFLSKMREGTGKEVPQAPGLGSGLASFYSI